MGRGHATRTAEADIIDATRGFLSGLPDRQKGMVDQEIAQRLRAARIEAGFSTARAFANAINVNFITYYHHENGRRGIPKHTAVRYALALNKPVGALLHKEQLPIVATATIVGVIGDGGWVTPIMEKNNANDPPPDDALNADDTSCPVCGDTADDDDDVTAEQQNQPDLGVRKIYLPDMRGLEALLVAADDHYPAYRIDDVVFTRALWRFPNGVVPQHLHGLDCVVELEDGRRILRQVLLQADGRVTLIGHAKPAMLNQRILAAEPVQFVQKYFPPGTV